MAGKVGLAITSSAADLVIPGIPFSIGRNSSLLKTRASEERKQPCGLSAARCDYKGFKTACIPCP